MPTRKIATIAAAGTIALLALGGTAFAAGADDTPAPQPPTATTAPATATPRATAGLEVEIEHGQVVVKPHGGSGDDRTGDDHRRNRGHGSDD